jgi:hypothetical protein
MGLHHVRDRDGKPISRGSKNLAGIRRYVSKGHRIKVIALDRIGQTGLEGKLCILFENGCSYETNFASFAVLCGWVGRWVSAYGSPLRVEGQDAGLVERGNPYLKGEKKMITVAERFRLEQAQRELGQTADEVSESLKRLGIKGLQREGHKCPLACYFRSLVPGLDIGVGFHSIFVDDEFIGPLTDACNAFRFRYDGGSYPELNAKG